VVKAGSEVDAWCTKCRLDLLHRVVAVVSGAPKRVECETCGSQHNYRAPKSSPAVRKTSARQRTAAGSTRSKTAVSDWDRFVANQAESRFVNYSPNAKFEAAQLIRHTKFGNGYVLEALPDGKINVLFRTGNRLLVHGR